MTEPKNVDVLGPCLRVAVDGPYFPDWEFHTLMGLSRDEMRAIADAWPSPPIEALMGYESPEHAQRVAVNNAANSLVGGYPHGVAQPALEKDLDCTFSDVARALTSWRHR